MSMAYSLGHRCVDYLLLYQLNDLSNDCLIVLMFIMESMEGKKPSIFEALGADLKISLRTNPVVSLM